MRILLERGGDMGRLLLIETTKSKSPVIFEIEVDDLSKVRVV